MTLDSQAILEERGMRTGVDYNTEFLVRIAVDRSIAFDTLVSLFKYPVNWNTPRAPQPIRGVHSIVLWAGAAVIGSSREEAAQFRNMVTQLSINIVTGFDGERHVMQAIFGLGHLLPAMTMAYSASSSLIVTATDEMIAHACVRSASIVICLDTSKSLNAILPLHHRYLVLRPSIPAL
jgi:hypothetical protein